MSAWVHGPAGLFFSVVATVWNYVTYNLGLDKLLLRCQGHTHKALWQRVLHTLGFEGSAGRCPAGHVLVARHRPAGRRWC